MKKLSIIIPIYNVEKYIRKCLESILNESTKGLPFEVIVVNDGTPDKSMAIVDEFVKEFGNLVVLEQDNQGQGQARNYGLSIAQGEYIWFVDSDDWIENNAVQSLLKFIDSEGDIDMFITPYYWYYSENNSHIDINIDELKIMSGLDFLKKGYVIAACRFIFRKSLMIDNSVFFNKGILHEDGIWGFEMLYLAKIIEILKNPLYYYRQRSDSDMHSIKIKSGYDLIKIHQLLNTFMEQYVAQPDRAWFKKWNMLRLEGSVSIVWHLRKTKEFRQFIKDTRDYRCKVCDECMSLGGLKWKMKCWLFKHPVLNKRRRLLFDKIKSLVKK